MTDKLVTELETYRKNINDLLGRSGSFVLIKGEDIIEIFDEYADALEAGYDRFGLEQAFLVKKIAPAEQVASFTRDYVIECRA